MAELGRWGERAVGGNMDTGTRSKAQCRTSRAKADPVQISLVRAL